MVAQQLTLLQWNCNSVRPRMIELKNFIFKNNPAIVCLQETKLKEKHKLRIPGYKSFRKDRPGDIGAGGVAILVANEIPCQEFEVKTKTIENIAVKINLKGGDIDIINIYDTSGTYDVDNEDYNKVFQDRTKTIILGDFNAHAKMWDPSIPQNEKRGRDIEDYIIENDLVLLNLPGTKTFFKSNGAESAIDLTIVHPQIAPKCTWSVQNNMMGSDHCPILIKINEEIIEPIKKKRKFIFAKANWPLYKTKLKNTKINNNNNIEQINSDITKAIIGAAEEAIPRTKANPKKRAKELPYWDPEIQNNIDKRNTARNKLKRIKSLENQITYKRLKAVAQIKLKHKSNTYWHEYCNTIDKNTKLGSVWKKLKRMTNNQDSFGVETIKVGDTEALTSKEKADLLAQSYEYISANTNYNLDFSRTKTARENIIKQQVKTKIAENTNIPSFKEDIGLNELKYGIKCCKKDKSAGPDEITYEMLKNLPPEFLEVVLKFLNKIWQDGNLPEAWKHAIILPFRKPAKPANNPTSYRPISLTSCLCKIMERIVTDRLTTYLEQNNLLNPAQAGFRKGLSTVDQIVKLSDQIHKSLKMKHTTVAAFLDFEKAYDMLWRDGLMQKLITLGVNSKMLGFINNFINNRTFQVKVNETLSEKKILENGTPQGSVISPILFLVMINDLKVSDPKTQQSIFADDSAIYRSGPNQQRVQNKIQDGLDEIEKWCIKWGFKLSAQKSVIVVFSNKKVNMQHPFTINDEIIEIKGSAKFLGVIFDSKLNWNEHIEYVVQKCKSRLNLMRAISGTKFGARKKPLLTIYRALIRSVIDYGAVAYDTASKSNLHKIDRIQSRALRICCGANITTPILALQNECGEAPLSHRRTLQQTYYKIKVMTTPNHMNRSVFEEHWSDKSKKRMSPSLFAKTKHINVDTVIPIDRETVYNENITVDDQLKLILNKTDNPLKLKHLSLAHIADCNGPLHIYTDGSKDQGGRVGAAFWVPEFKYSEKYRLTDNSTVYTSEIEAIKKALNFVKDQALTRDVIIFTDSLSAVQALNNIKNNVNDKNVKSICRLANNINANIKITWIPGHAGIPGNEEVDKLAKEATTHQTVDLAIPAGINELRERADKYMLSQWQIDYDNSPKGLHYKEIEPKVSLKTSKNLGENRRKECVILGLKLGSFMTNKRKNLVGSHPSGECPHCIEEESIRHMVVECRHNPLASKIRNIFIGKNPAELNLGEVLQHNEAVELIYKYTLTRT